PFDDLVLMTGEGLRRLMKVVRRIDVEKDFVAALARMRKFARGPKPGRALREIGLEPQQTTEKPTSEGIAEMLSRIDLKGRRLGRWRRGNLCLSFRGARQREPGISRSRVRRFASPRDDPHNCSLG